VSLFVKVSLTLRHLSSEGDSVVDAAALLPFSPIAGHSC